MKLLNGQRNQCQSCKEYFNSVGAFEKHRTGKYGVSRRCRTPEELLALGCSLNKDGFWITKKRPEDSYTPRSQDNDD
jgi:hypothetical protein